MFGIAYAENSSRMRILWDFDFFEEFIFSLQLM